MRSATPRRLPTGRTLSAYKPRDRVLSAAESAFLTALRTALSGRYEIFPKMRLLDLCQSIDVEQHFAAFGHIASRHVDFTLCEADSHPVLAVELDDRGHDDPPVQVRDEIVRLFFDAIGLPLARFPVQRRFDSAKIRARIQGQLAARQEHLFDPDSASELDGLRRRLRGQPWEAKNAIFEIGEAPHLALAAEVLELVSAHPTLELQEQAAWAFGKLTFLPAEAFLRSAAASMDQDVLLAACWALGQLATPGCEQTLLQVSRRPLSTNLAATVGGALKKCRGERARSHLAPTQRDDPVELRLRAIAAEVTRAAKRVSAPPAQTA